MYAQTQPYTPVGKPLLTLSRIEQLDRFYR
jgi:hypothetical protein